MKRLLTIFFILCAFFSEAQLKGTDTLRFMDRSNQWIVTNPYITAYGNLRFARIGIVPSHYTTSTLPGSPAQGAIFYNTDSVNKIALWTGSAYVYLGTSAASNVGITEINGLTGSVQTMVEGTAGTDFDIASSGTTHTFNLPDASASARGLVTTGTQTLGGTKTFTGTITVGNTSNGVINIANSSASTRGSIDLSSNNPTLNSATGTWLFRQTGNTVGLYNSVGFFFGGGSVPSGYVVGILAGTTTNAPLRLFSGPVTTSAVAGNVEFTTDDLFFTITTGAARKNVALWDALGATTRIPFGTTNSRLTTDANFRYASAELIVGSASDAGTFSFQNTGGLFQSGSVKIDLGSDATGDIYYRDGSGNFVRRAIGASGAVLTVSSGVPTWVSPLTMASGVYAATVTAVSNLSAATAPAEWSYMQIGSQVYVWGSVDVDPVTTATVTEVRFSLPVAASFADENECAGTAVFTNSSGNEAGNIKAETTNEQAILTWTTTTTANQRMFFSFGYRVGGS